MSAAAVAVVISKKMKNWKGNFYKENWVCVLKNVSFIFKF